MDYQHLVNALVSLADHFLTAVAIPAVIGLVKSELMALDKTSAANGIVHYFQLANKAVRAVEGVKQGPLDQS